MPSGYEAVDAAFGVHGERLSHDAGQYTMPVVEFRTGGDYALYAVTTACDGAFSRGAGTIFSSNGTVRGDVTAQDSQTVAANPQFEAVIDRVCAAAMDSRFVADPFQPRAALELLLGPLDADEEAAWTPGAGENVEEGLKWVSLRRSGTFTDSGGDRLAYIITGARDLACQARACGGGAIGGALFRFDDGKWRLASHTPVILSAGNYGEAAGGDAIRNLQGEDRAPLIRVDWGDCHMGECGMATSLIGVVEGRLTEVWSGASGAESPGTAGCADFGKCTDWSADIKLLGGNGAFPEIEVARKGQEWDWSAERLLEIDETLVYRYDPVGRYHEASRSGSVVEVPLPVQPPEPDSGFAEVPFSADQQPVPAMPDVHEGIPASSRAPDVEATVDEAARSMNPPRYPPAALRAGITGQVVLHVSVDAEGLVTDVAVHRSSRNRDLDRAAIQAARTWRFNPAVVDGRPVAGRVQVPVDFDLD